MPLIDVQNVSLAVEGKSILQNVSLSIEKGEIVTIIGPNGAGKSSLIKLMVNVLSPSAGRVIRAPELRIGYVPQKLQTTALMPMRVSRFLKSWGRTSREKRRAIIETYGVEELLDKPLSALSGGELRRVLFAHALLDEPNLLVLDEMTAGLDIAATAKFYEFIAELRARQNIAIVMVSHDLHVVMRASDRVICLNGHICCEGAPLDVSKTKEYAKIMGIPDPVALYEHHHDHHHDH